MILIGGENLMDLITQPSLRGSELNDTLTLRAVEGGSPYNTAVAAARLGAEVGYLTPISQDVFGAHLSARLESSGAQVLSERVPAPISLAIVSLQLGQASYQFYREGTAERCVNLDKLTTQLEHGHALHLGSLALTGASDGEVWTTLFERAQERGLFTSVDLNIRPRFIEDEAQYRARLERVMQSADLIKMSDEDLGWWVGRELRDAEEQRRACLALGRTFKPQLIFMTRGSRGVTAYLERRERVQVLERPADLARVFADTVGAGDTFMGAILATLDELVLRDAFFDGWTTLRIEHALRVGSIAAS